MIGHERTARERLINGGAPLPDRRHRQLAHSNGIDPDRISFVKVLKHTRRSVVRQFADTPPKIRRFLTAPTAKVRRKLDSGTRRPQEADRFLKRPNSLYSYRPKDNRKPYHATYPPGPSNCR
ncbi:MULTISPECIES: hypothetical protein [unclassified Streptomyces]|uniref:hypothetical protein n=1 Tax=unclassified Streptomyces TaxID=2593676 RepID=UPI0036471B1F